MRSRANVHSRNRRRHVRCRVMVMRSVSFRRGRNACAVMGCVARPFGAICRANARGGRCDRHEQHEHERREAPRHLVLRYHESALFLPEPAPEEFLSPYMECGERIQNP